MDLNQIASEYENTVTCDDIILKAFDSNKPEIVSFILEGGYKPKLSKTDTSGSSIFYHLVKNSDNISINNYITELIKNNNVPVETLNLQNGGGDTAFHVAIRNGNNQLAQLLEQSGASRIQNNDGEIPYTLKSPRMSIANADNNQNIDNASEYIKDTIQPFDIAQFINTFKTSEKQQGGEIVNNEIFTNQQIQTTNAITNVNTNNSTEQFVQKIINKLTNITPPAQSGGKYNMHRNTIREANNGIDSEEAKHVTRLYRNHVDDLHQETIKQIKELMNVDDHKAKCYKAYLYKKIKDEHPELNGYDRATEMLKHVKKDVLKAVDIDSLCAEIQKHISEKQNSKPTKKNHKSTSEKKMRKRKSKHDVSSDSSLLAN